MKEQDESERRAGAASRAEGVSSGLDAAVFCRFARLHECRVYYVDQGLSPRALFLAERTRKRGPQLKGKGHAQALPDPQTDYIASLCCRSTPARHDWRRW